jgi:hypothetical protein
MMALSSDLVVAVLLVCGECSLHGVRGNSVTECAPLTFDLLLSSGARVAFGDCTTASELEPMLVGDQCETYITYPVLLDAPGLLNVSQRGAAALAAYQGVMLQWRDHANVSAECLSFTAYYECLKQYPYCKNDVLHGICEWTCEERNLRCEESLGRVPCDVGLQNGCAAAAGIPLPVLAFLALAVAVFHLLISWDAQ